MNTRDERLYHYEYRRPRVNNPTYNSNHIFESLNTFTRIEQPTSQLYSYGRYSLAGNQNIMANKSDITNSRNPRLSDNRSMNLPPAEERRQSRVGNDKDSLYLQMIDQKNRSKSNRNYNYEMKDSHLSENAENRVQYNSKRDDSLTKEIKEFDSHRR